MIFLAGLSLWGHLTLSGDGCLDPSPSERKLKRRICSLSSKCCLSAWTSRKHYLPQSENSGKKRGALLSRITSQAAQETLTYPLLRNMYKRTFFLRASVRATAFLDSTVLNNFLRVYKGSFLLVLRERQRHKAKVEFSESSSTEERIKKRYSEITILLSVSLFFVKGSFHQQK